MNNYLKLDEIFKNYKENEDLIFIKINTGSGLTFGLTDSIFVFIVNKKQLNVNRKSINAHYIIEIPLERKERISTVYSKILMYISANYNINNLFYINYNIDILYCNDKIFNKLIKIIYNINIENEGLSANIDAKGEDFVFNFNFKFPYNKINYWFNNNIIPIEEKIEIVKGIISTYKNKINFSKKEIERLNHELDITKNNMELFFQFLTDEQKLLLEL